MSDLGQELRFGSFLTPGAAEPRRAVELAQASEAAGLDLVTFQDHPYQSAFLDTWTLLSAVAERTSRVLLAPNVANLPLRPPALLARSVASLDLLSGGRVELGLGAGLFYDAIAALGGPRLTPGASVDALGEALEVIRSFWDAERRSVSFTGEHYRYQGAKAGPAPAHPVEIWLGALKPRMLALTGAKADGWLPSSAYAGPETLADSSARIDEAALAAGRDPAQVRRLYNLMGRFGTGAGFLEGGPGDWAEQLAGLTLVHGTSTFILASDDEGDLRRFAQEVAPAVRELVAAERASATAVPAAAGVPAPSGPAAARPLGPGARAARRAPEVPFSLVPTPDDGRRLSPERPWDDAGRPSGPRRDPDRRYRPNQLRRGQRLIDVHDVLRGEVATLRDLITQVADGILDPAAARTLINRMTIRQNSWTLGAFCESYCRMVTQHHTIESSSVFPHLRSKEAALAPVLDRLHVEHEVIAELLERVDERLVDLVSGGADAPGGLQATVDLVTDAMASHLSYEEHELVEPLARLGFGPA